MPAGTCVLLGSARHGTDVSFEVPEAPVQPEST